MSKDVEVQVGIWEFMINEQKAIEMGQLNKLVEQANHYLMRNLGI